MAPITLSLQWRKSGADEYTAYDGDTPVGRIYIYNSQSDRSDWYWTMYGSIGNVHGSSWGHESTPREAAKRVEDAWEAMKARLGVN